MDDKNSHQWVIVDNPDVAMALLLIAVKAQKDFDGDILNIQGHPVFVHVGYDIVTEDVSTGNRIGNKVWLWEKDTDPGKLIGDKDRVIIIADTLAEAQGAALVFSTSSSENDVKNIRTISASEMGSLNFTYLEG